MIIGLTAVDGFMDFSTFAAMLKATIPCARARTRALWRHPPVCPTHSLFPG
jgi:hypothetical protein